MLSDFPAAASITRIPVGDFRRHRMVLNWNPQAGTWTPCDVPPALVHGLALIRPSQLNICVFGQAGALHLQAGTERFLLGPDGSGVHCIHRTTSLGMRRRFLVESAGGTVLFDHTYWAHQGEDFFGWLADRASRPDWRADSGRRWTAGLDRTSLRNC